MTDIKYDIDLNKHFDNGSKHFIKYYKRHESGKPECEWNIEAYLEAVEDRQFVSDSNFRYQIMECSGAYVMTKYIVNLSNAIIDCIAKIILSDKNMNVVDRNYLCKIATTDYAKYTKLSEQKINEVIGYHVKSFKFLHIISKYQSLSIKFMENKILHGQQFMDEYEKIMNYSLEPDSYHITNESYCHERFLKNRSYLNMMYISKYQKLTISFIKKHIKLLCPVGLSNNIHLLRLNIKFVNGSKNNIILLLTKYIHRDLLKMVAQYYS